MQTMKFSHIASLLQFKPFQQSSDPGIRLLLTDSRKLLFAEESLFFSISSLKKNANEFIAPLYAGGVRCFITDHFSQEEAMRFPDANVIVVPDVIDALHTIASFHRHQFTYPVIGITGSNGKTIVKEWLFQLLETDYEIVRSPKSYNSQLGVPLSVWQMDETYSLGIFEAGISLPGEMEKLQEIIDPGIGVFTFLGSAHDEGFRDRQHKVEEKLKLFSRSSIIIYCSDETTLHHSITKFIADRDTRTFTWGKKNNPDLLVKDIVLQGEGNVFQCQYQGKSFSFHIPFKDEASIHNALTCAAVLLFMGIEVDVLVEKMGSLRPVEMRLELKQGTNNCSIINDSYSADIHSLKIALDFLAQQQQHSRRTVILSDVLGSGQPGSELYKQIAAILTQKKIHRFIGIGSQMNKYAAMFDGGFETHFFSSSADFIREIPGFGFRDETILLKGARVFRFEQISRLLEQKQHQTVLEIDLNALRHNIKVYQHQLQPSVRLMAMVKAFSYGSGSFEIANLLQHAGIDYLGVAYADEGVELRKAGIRLPIMVMNTEEAGFDAIVANHLEPELYSFRILRSFSEYLQSRGLSEYPVHIMYETGMHRLGFEETQLAELCSFLRSAPEFKIVSFFSHLAASGEAKHDVFTRQQGELLLKAAASLEAALGYKVMKHIANTAGIHRHPSLQLDMVRLGIGMYGIDEDEHMQSQLKNVTTLKTSISQIKIVEAGESIGYGRSAFAESEMRIATVRIGYADGYPRLLGNGVGHMLVKGQLAPVVGRVCMDMTMLDVTGIPTEEEDEVVVFGESLPVNSLAGWAGTIAYEILTNISQRVRRVYFEE
jgi:alanine racemase